MEVNKLFNPDSDTLGKLRGTRKECINAVRLLNRVIDGAYFIESYTHSIPRVKDVSCKGVDTILAFADYAERILKLYRKECSGIIDDRDQEIIDRSREFIRSLKKIASINYGDMFSCPHQYMKIRSKLSDIMRGCDYVPNVEDKAFIKFANAFEELRGVIFNDVLNWDYVLDLMDTLPNK